MGRECHHTMAPRRKYGGAAQAGRDEHSRAAHADTHGGCDGTARLYMPRIHSDLHSQGLQILLLLMLPSRARTTTSSSGVGRAITPSSFCLTTLVLSPWPGCFTWPGPYARTPAPTARPSDGPTGLSHSLIITIPSRHPSIQTARPQLVVPVRFFSLMAHHHSSITTVPSIHPLCTVICRCRSRSNGSVRTKQPRHEWNSCRSPPSLPDRAPAVH